MKNIYFTVGPSELYPTVPKHIKHFLAEDIGSISHRGKAFEVIFQETTNSFRTLLAIPKTYHIFFLSSALEGMERSIQNTVQTYSAHIITGDFGKKFSQTSLELGKKPKSFSFAIDTLSEIERISIPKKTELLCVTQNETSTGVAIPPEKIYAYKKQNPDLLIAFDVVSSVPYQKLDFSFLDLVFFSVQKGFGLPAGLGVLIVSSQALEKAAFLQRKGILLGSYHSFSSLLEKEQKYQTPETPNAFAIYLLGRIIGDLKMRSIEVIRKDIRLRADKLYEVFDKSPYLAPLVKDPDFRSPTTLVIHTAGKTSSIQKRLKEKQLIISSGYGKNKDTHIRIANFPAHSQQDFNRLLKTLSKIAE